MSGSSLASLGVSSPVKNGVIQIVTSCVFIILAVVGWVKGIEPCNPQNPGAYQHVSTSACLYFIGGFSTFFIVAGKFFLLGGIFMLLAGVRGSMCLIPTALVFGVINIPLSLAALGSSCFLFFVWSDALPVLSAFTIITVYAQLFAVFWAVVITSRAIRYSKGAKVEVPNDYAGGSLSLKANWIAQMLTTFITVVLSIFCFGSSIRDSTVPRPPHSYFGSNFVWCAPLYILNVCLGIRASRIGEKSSLISFLVLNIIQLPLTSLELYMGVLSLHQSPRMIVGWISVEYILTISAGLRLLFSIWAIISSCSIVFCCSGSTDGGEAGKTAKSVGAVASAGANGADGMVASWSNANGAADSVVLMPTGSGGYKQVRIPAGQKPANAGQIPNTAGEVPYSSY